MTTPTSDSLTALADELGRIGRRLDGMGVELLALRQSASGPTAFGGRPPAQLPTVERAPLPPSGPGQMPPVPGWGAPVQPGWAPQGPVPPAPPAGLPPYQNWGVPQGGPTAMAPAAPPAAPRAPRPRRWSISGARLLAWTGGAVTLLGVVLLLALAASRGWFTPPARIAFGAVLGAGLVGLGMWLHRRETARTGALALVATGFATLYLVDAAATAVYDYLPAVLALLLALLIAGAGLGLADRWRTELLACGVVVGAAVLAPALADGWLLAALALALQLAALPVVLRRRWAGLMLLAAAGPVLYGASAVINEDNGTPNVLVVVGVAAAVLMVAAATAALALRVRLAESATNADQDGSDSTSGTVPQGRSAGPRMWVGSIAAVVAASVLPALAGAPVLDGWRGALVAVGAAVLLAGLAVVPPTVRAIRIAAGTAALTALFTATVVGLSGSAVDIALLGEALVAALLAVGLRSRFAMITALVLGAIGGLSAVLQYAPLSTLLRFYAPTGVADLVTAVVVSVLLIALSAALLVAGGRLGWVRPDAERAAIWVPIGLVGLYGAASVVVNAALLIAPTPSGFTAGHAVVTVSWTVGALFLLARGLRRPALRITGLVLVGAAVAKLVLFDLVALDGLARVGAFLGAGLVLLAAGTRYARLVAEADKPPSE
jgi:uncharacterized membrane protein